MNTQTALLAVAIICFALVTIVPQMMRLRIGVLRWLHWNWLADLHENHFDGFVLAVRIILVVVGLTLLVVGLAGGQ